MTSFRKIRLPGDQSNSLIDNTNPLKYETSVNVSRLSDLDRNIESILNQNIDDNLKLKLYSQTLRRFLSYKKLKQHEDIAYQQNFLNSLKNILQETTKKPEKKKPLSNKSLIAKYQLNKKDYLKKISSAKKSRQNSAKKEPKIIIETPSKVQELVNQFNLDNLLSPTKKQPVKPQPKPRSQTISNLFSSSDTNPESYGNWKKYKK